MEMSMNAQVNSMEAADLILNEQVDIEYIIVKKWGYSRKEELYHHPVVPESRLTGLALNSRRHHPLFPDFLID